MHQSAAVISVILQYIILLELLVVDCSEGHGALSCQIIIMCYTYQ